MGAVHRRCSLGFVGGVALLAVSQAVLELEPRPPEALPVMLEPQHAGGEATASTPQARPQPRQDGSPLPRLDLVGTKDPQTLATWCRDQGLPAKTRLAAFRLLRASPVVAEEVAIGLSADPDRSLRLRAIAVLAASNSSPAQQALARLEGHDAYLAARLAPGRPR